MSRRVFSFCFVAALISPTIAFSQSFLSQYSGSYSSMTAGFSTLRTELFQLLVIPFLAQHPIQTTASFRAMATLAIFRPRRIVRGQYLLRHSGRLRTVTCAASTSRKRNSELPLFRDMPRPSLIPARLLSSPR
jgi:hypothetical protein